MSARKSAVDYVVDDATGCWNWQLYVRPNGYGTAWDDGGIALAHRLYYERHVGPIPEGLQLDHLCRNRACVNPDHLEPVTRAENLRRGHGARLTHADVEAIRASGEPGVDLAQRLGVTATTIQRVRRGETWSN